MSAERAAAIAIRRASARTATSPAAARSLLSSWAIAVTAWPTVVVSGLDVAVVAAVATGIGATREDATTARRPGARHRRSRARVLGNMLERSRTLLDRGMGHRSRGGLDHGHRTGPRPRTARSPPIRPGPTGTPPDSPADLWDHRPGRPAPAPHGARFRAPRAGVRRPESWRTTMATTRRATATWSGDLMSG